MKSPDQPKPTKAELDEGIKSPTKSMNRRQFLGLGARLAALAGSSLLGAVSPQVRPPLRPRTNEIEEKFTGVAYPGRPGEHFYNPQPLPQEERLFNFPISNPLDTLLRKDLKPVQRQAIFKKISSILHPPITVKSIFRSMVQLYDNPFDRAKNLEGKIRKVLDESGKFSNIPQRDKDIFIRLIQAVALIESKAKHEADNKDQKIIGIMQLSTATAQELNTDHGINADPKTEEGNLLLGALYLRWMIKAAEGDIIKACAMYNLGIGTMVRAEEVFYLKYGQKSSSYEELIRDPEVVRYILNNNDHISSPDELNDVYRYPAAYIRLFYEKEFEETKS